jgi:hypothetical protein
MLKMKLIAMLFVASLVLPGILSAEEPNANAQNRAARIAKFRENHPEYAAQMDAIKKLITDAKAARAAGDKAKAKDLRTQAKDARKELRAEIKKQRLDTKAKLSEIRALRKSCHEARKAGDKDKAKELRGEIKEKFSELPKNVQDRIQKRIAARKAGDKK